MMGERVRCEAVTVAEARSRSMAALYERHARDATRLAYFLVGDLGLAEELMQDTFVRVFARLEHLRDPDTLWPYVCRTIANLSRKHFRRQRIERAFLRRLDGSEPSSTTTRILYRHATNCGESSRPCPSGNGSHSSFGSTRTCQKSRRRRGRRTDRSRGRDVHR
jgi:Sigma-70 region 2